MGKHNPCLALLDKNTVITNSNDYQYYDYALLDLKTKKIKDYVTQELYERKQKYELNPELKDEIWVHIRDIIDYSIRLDDGSLLFRI